MFDACIKTITASIIVFGALYGSFLSIKMFFRAINNYFESKEVFKNTRPPWRTISESIGGWIVFSIITWIGYLLLKQSLEPIIAACESFPFISKAINDSQAINCFDFWANRYQTLFTGIGAIVIGLFTYLLTREHHFWEKRQDAQIKAAKKSDTD